MTEQPPLENQRLNPVQIGERNKLLMERGWFLLLEQNARYLSPHYGNLIMTLEDAYEFELKLCRSFVLN